MSDDQGDAIESTSSTAVSDPGSPVKSEPAAALCPYCGSITPTGARCSQCRGLLDPLSRQATTNTMGPWFIRDEAQPFRPGCSYHTLVSLVQRGKVTRTTIIRGPSTRQFWMFAGKVPGVAHLLGVCHSCQEESHADDFACNNCGAVFTAEEDRQRLGLGPQMEVPGQPLPDSRPPAKEVVARAASVAGSVAGPESRTLRSSTAMSAIMDDPALWDARPRKSSGVLVGGVILSIAVLAAAGFAVKTWVEANQPADSPTPDVQNAPAASPAQPVPLSKPPSADSSTPSDDPPPNISPESPPVRPISPPAGPNADLATTLPISWVVEWRSVRGLP
ncbi:MAG: hypothetical protein IT434_13730 [Phycisphaerales bacterium]|nr:hypothetical protein [Phycisphaerales bacterium]